MKELDFQLFRTPASILLYLKTVGESSPTNIMWNTGHSYSQINRLLSKLYDYGLVKRKSGKQRGVEYSLTRDGMELALRIEEIVKITKKYNWNILPKSKVSKQPSV